MEKKSLKKGAWSPQEDQKLIAYIKRYGIWNWAEMAKPAGLQRTGKSCRLRWVNYLRPGIKHGNFTKEEEQTIIDLHEELGNRWSLIASRLPGRTDNEVKNHWNAHLCKRFKYDLNLLPESDPSQTSDAETNQDSSFGISIDSLPSSSSNHAEEKPEC